MGATFYELFNQQKVFSAKSPLELIHYHIAKQVYFPEKIRKKLPKSLLDIILKLLSKSPEERYQSAIGVKNDLEICLDYILNNIPYFDFQIGQKDFSDIIVPSKKLLGREKEFNVLMNEFEGLEQNSEMRIIFISGDTGTGKTSLVLEVSKKFIEKDAIFIRGKFEPFKSNIQFFAFEKAFNSFIDIILSSSEVKLKRWKEILSSTLGSMGGKILDIFPKFELLIGKQINIQTPNSLHEENQFHIIMHKFLQALSSKENPLVIFLDNIHWADYPSIKLLNTIIHEEPLENFYIICSYQTEKLSNSKQLQNLIQDKSTNSNIRYLNLKPLTLDNTKTFLRNTFHNTSNCID